MEELVYRIREIAKRAEAAGDNVDHWRSLLAELAHLSEALQAKLESVSTSRMESRSVSSPSKISTMCNPKLARILRAEAEAQGKPPSRLVAEIVEQFVSRPPARDSETWWYAPIRIVRSLMGRETLTAAVDSSTKEKFEAMIPRVQGVTNKSQLLAWVIWNHLGRPKDRS